MPNLQASMLRELALLALAVAGWLRGAAAQQVDPIVIKGSKFFYSGNGTQFFIRGVAYQQDFTPTRGVNTTGYNDPLADASGCARDLPYLVQLRTNTVRVYAIDPTQDHTECMTMFANAGIYVLADLSSPQESINQIDPHWNTDLYSRYTSVVDAMANYTNLLGFFAGNEVAFAPNSTDAAPFVKAAVRDMKSYIKSKDYRPIGVGYATNDNPYIRVPLANYMNCGDNQDEAIDFWGYNVYSWCGDSTFEESGYADRTEEFGNYSVPVFLAEYGCNNPQPRMFGDTPVLYGPDMQGVWSGGIVYLYFQEVNDYGLVSVDGNSVSTLQDFDNLSSQIATVAPSGPNSASFSPTNSPQACPTQDADFSAAASPLPPSPDVVLCNCMFSALECTISDDVSAEDYGDLFGVVCGLEDGICDGITANGTTGQYGTFGMCDSKLQLGYVLNEYYQGQGQNPSACDFSGSAATQAAATPTGQCVDALSSVGFSTSGGGGAGGGSSTQTKKGGASSISTAAGVDVGYFTAGIMAWVAVVSGVGMVVL